MILKRNISTFAAVLGLMAIMLLSASPAKAFKTSNPDMTIAYDTCLTINFQGKAKNVKKCFEDFRTTHAENCLSEAGIVSSLIASYTAMMEDNMNDLTFSLLSSSDIDTPEKMEQEFIKSQDAMIQTLNGYRDRMLSDVSNLCRWDIDKVRSEGMLN